MPTIQEIEDRFRQYAEEFAIEQFPSKHREHLGASEIGETCSRKIFYKFHWVKLEQHEPRMRRLFNRGHLQEPFFEQFLMWAGVHQRSVDPETNKQFQFSKINGHYGGSNDGIGIISWADNLRILTEFKTHNNKSFDKLVKINPSTGKKYGVISSKPQHYAQMCAYGREWKLEYGLYCAVNKDDEDWHLEMVKLDWNFAAQLELKAQDIINANQLPQRVAENPDFFDCKYCHFKGICFDNEPVELNCRSCKFCEPVENGNWKCHRWNDIVPKDFVVKGCPEHISINIK